jgi:transposase
MYDITRLIPQEQFDFLLELLPTPRQKKTGRKRCKKEHLLSGILQVLKLGIGWNDIFDCGCSGSSCWRYFKEIQRRCLFKQVFKKLSDDRTDISECASDTDTIWSYRFKGEVGWDGRHRMNGTKISLLTDIDGLPADVIIESAKTFDGNFIDRHMENMAGRRKRVLNLDKIYVSLTRRREYRRKGTFINMETRDGDYIRKKGPKFSFDKEKYKVRFKIERTFGWLENFRRIRHRVDRYISSFRAFVYLALIIILIRS